MFTLAGRLPPCACLTGAVPDAQLPTVQSLPCFPDRAKGLSWGCDSSLKKHNIKELSQQFRFLDLEGQDGPWA